MNKRGLGGFALPTVLVASIIMMVVLLSAVGSSAAVRGAIVDQYYNQLSRSAADSGIAYAQACLDSNGVTWSDSSPLGPNTDCYGVQLAGFTCVDNYTEPRCFASYNDRIISTFSVMSPDVDSTGEVTKISSKGTAALLRSSDNTPRRQYSHTSQLIVSEPTTSTIQVLVVAGGGGGGSSAASGGGGGGGGAGGLIYRPDYPVIKGQTFNVSIGGGGAPGGAGLNQTGVNGGNSVFGSITAIGGGFGATQNGNGGSGGSGGGGGFNNYATVRSGGGSSLGQGSAGGSTSLLAWAGGAGGGGAGGAGGENKINHIGGDGGPGLAFSISGSPVTYSIGGGGGANNPVASPANTGKGGDAAYAAGTAYAGGSGVVIISYPTGSLTATGGTITTSGSNTIHTFTSGSSNFTIINNSPYSSDLVGAVRALVVAGGGGGVSGGGGAGGVVYKPSMQVGVGSYSVTVGNGGAGGLASTGAGRTNGQNSVFNSITAVGGGAGGTNDKASSATSGGSGGGGGSTSTVQTNGGARTDGQGNVGGTVASGYFASPFPAAGGGGSNGVGGNPTAATVSGNGGVGTAYYITGSSVYYGGGGGGSTWSNGTHGAGGSGGGGAGGYPNGVAGTANTGGGGGGGAGGGSGTGGSGGSGVVIISYPTGSLTATGGTITTSGGNTIHRFTSSGTFIVSSVGVWRYKRPVTVTNSNSTTLTDSQVQVTPFTDASLLNNNGLVGSWHFNEDSGVLNTTAFDMSGNGNHGSMGGTTYRTTSGKFGGAFIGNGTNLNKVLIPASPSIDVTTALSIEAWVYPSSSVTKEIIGRMNSGGTAPVSYELFQNGQKISFRLFKLAAATTWTTNTNMAFNTWYHIVATWDGSTVKIYVNGVLDMAPAAYTGSIDSSPTVGISIGAYGDNSYLFSGKIDEVKIYNRALSGPATNCAADSANEICRRYGPLGVPKIRSDYADIRFTNSDGTVNYSYWQESDSKFWVKIPSLVVGDTNINMYYGNPKANSASDGDSTFAFFDNFNGSVINTAKWTELDAKASIAQSNGLVLTTVTSVWDSALISKTKFNRVASLTVNGSFKSGASVVAPKHVMAGWSSDQEADPSYTKLVHGVYFNAGSLANAYELATPYLGVGSYIGNSYNMFEVKLKSTGADYYNNGSAIYTGFGGSLTTSPMRIGIHQHSHDGIFYYIFVRQGSNLEPTLSAPGAETSLFSYSRL